MTGMGYPRPAERPPEYTPRNAKNLPPVSPPLEMTVSQVYNGKLPDTTRKLVTETEKIPLNHTNPYINLQ